MKNHILTALTLTYATVALAQGTINFNNNDGVYQIVERSMDCRTWTKTVTTTDPVTGVVTSQVSSYQDLGNGICYQPAGPGGAWADSQDLVEATATGAQAVHGPFPATFGADITSPNPITLFPPVIGSAAQAALQLAPIGLFYFDPTPPARIAQIGLFQPSRGQLHGNNVLVYPDVIPGMADLVVVWTHAGVEESIVMKKAPAPPASYGLSGASTLQYWAAFNGPQPVEQRHVLLNSGLEDHILMFDGFWMPVGGVFAAGQRPLPALGQSAQIHLVDPSAPGTVCLAKSLVNIGSQTVLIEEVRYSDLLAQLKQMGLAALPRAGGNVVQFADRGQLLSPPARPKLDCGSVQVASAPYIMNGVVMDPYILLSGTTNSYTFSSGTYFISNSYSVGTATFQDGACIKFATNAYLLVSGSATFPSSGQVQLTSMDDNSLGAVITNSTSEPAYAAAKELWFYHANTNQTVRNATFAWAQRGVQCDLNCVPSLPGSGGVTMSSCAFHNCGTGVYENMSGCTLTLSSDTYCQVPTPLYVLAGAVSGSLNNNCGTPATNLPVDASQTNGIEGEPAIAVNPTDPNNLFMAANHQSGDPNTRTIGWARSLDGGATWSSFTNLASSFSDPSVAFDAFGNLFVCYLDHNPNVMVLLSTNKGSSFAATNRVLSGNFDWTRIATGPGSVWVTSYDYGTYPSVDSNAVNSAAVTGLGMVGQWTNSVLVPGTGPDPGAYLGYGYGDIAVGPTGQVAVVVWNSAASTNGPTEIRISLNPSGTNQSTGFLPAWRVLTSKVGFPQQIPAQTNRGIHPNPGLAWDRTGAQFRGRLYMVYTDCPSSGSTNDTDIYVIRSDDNGTNWSGAVKINTDNNGTSQFFPRIAVDQTSGKVAVSWYDCRADTFYNRKTQFYAAVSSDGGATFSSSNLQLETGQSDISRITYDKKLEYFDYTGLAFYGGYFCAAWADNSNATTNNPDGTAGMDIYIAKVRY